MAGSYYGADGREKKCGHGEREELAVGRLGGAVGWVGWRGWVGGVVLQSPGGQDTRQLAAMHVAYKNKHDGPGGGHNLRAIPDAFTQVACYMPDARGYIYVYIYIYI